ncbi:MAG TPA: hypothetical protein VFF48_02150 [Brevundimonas sp.]|nr:hypothetical protein [Brevundimonas sp.]
MNENIVAVVFNSHTQAEEAAMELRQQGVSDQSISIVAQDGGSTTQTDGAGEDVADKAGDAVKGALGGGALGAVLGIAALAIPGVGPLIGAGAIAASAAGGAAATGAAIGAVGGGLVGLMTDHGVDEHDARYFEQHINHGGVFLSVDTSQSGVSPLVVRDILERNGGHRAERSQGASGLGSSPSM